MRHRRTRPTVLAGVVVLAITLAACGGDDDASVATTVAPTSGPASTTAISAATSAPRTTAPATTAATTSAPTTTTAPDPLSGRPGVGVVELAPSGDPVRPTFTWTAVDGADRYQLVVRTRTGPVWGWSGRTTTVLLGEVERPADGEGPALSGPAEARVYAFGADGALLAVSAWVAVGAS